MDGIQGGNSGGLIATFDQDETTAMVRKIEELKSFLPSATAAA